MRVEYLSGCRKFVHTLSREEAEELRAGLLQFARDPRPDGVMQTGGGFLRRVGRFALVFSIEGGNVVVIRILRAVK